MARNIALSQVDPYLKDSVDRFIALDPSIDDPVKFNEGGNIILGGGGGGGMLWRAFIHLAFYAAQLKQENTFLKEENLKLKSK